MREEVLEKARREPRGVPARILDAAEEVFAERGYGAASTREIARRAEVPFGAVHYYWGSKQALKEAVYRRLMEQSRDTVTQSLAPGAALGQIVDNLVDGFVELLASNRNATRLWSHALLEDPPDARVDAIFDQLLFDFGRAALAEQGPGDQIDGLVALHVLGNAFLGAIADEAGQRRALGDTVFDSPIARERLRAELRRLARATFRVPP